MRLLLVALFTASAAFCQKQQTCPWMNAATAGWILEGAVTGEVVHSSQNSNDGTCEFVRQPAPPAYALRIEVETMASPSTEFSSLTSKCGSNVTPLKAIGNEAVACSKEGRHGQRIEEVVGRVRDRVFIIRLTTIDQAAARPSLREKAVNVAEQVAGILF